MALTTIISKEWAKNHPNGYEVSSRGDKRFSALTARLKSGKTIEESWAAAKGYPSIRAAKGKPAKDPNFDYWKVYLGLWRKWAAENPRGIEELERVSRGKVLTDQFAKTGNNQARALATIINERSAPKRPLSLDPYAASQQPKKLKRLKKDLKFTPGGRPIALRSINGEMEVISLDENDEFTESSSVKSLTTRTKNTTGLKVGEVGTMYPFGDSGFPLFVTYLGRKTYAEAQAIAGGGEARYAEAEGFPAGSTLNEETKTGYFGRDRTKTVALFALSATAPAKTTKKKAATTKKKAATKKAKKASTRTPRTPRSPRHRQAQKAPENAHLAVIGATFPWSKSTRFDQEKDMEVPAPVTGTLIVYPINPRAALYAAEALSAKDEEAAAVKGVTFGVLSGFEKKDVITFAKNVDQQPVSWPLPSKIVDRDANIVSLLVASGNPDDLTAESLFPLGKNAWFGNRSIASILFNAIMFGLWRYPNKWVGEVYFVLPQAQMRGLEPKEYDATGAARLIEYLCGASNDSCPSTSFLGDLQDATDWLGKNLPEKYYKKFLGIKSDYDKKVLFANLRKSLKDMPIGYQVGEKGEVRTVTPSAYYGSDPFDRSLATERKDIRRRWTEGDVSAGLRDRSAKREMSTADFDSFEEIYARQTDDAARDLLTKIRLGYRRESDLDDEELKKLEALMRDGFSSLGRSSVAKGAPKKRGKKAKTGLPLTSQGPLISLMFTLYWSNPGDAGPLHEYKIVAQSKSYTIGDIQRRIGKFLNKPHAPYVPQEGEDPDQAMEMGETAALRHIALTDMGIQSLNMMIGESKLKPVRPKLLVAVTANYKRALSGVELGLPKPVKITEAIGMYFAEVYLTTTKKGLIAESDFTSPWVKEGKSDLIPKVIPQSAETVIGKSLLGVETTRKGKLRKKPSNLFSFANIEKTDSYQYAVKSIQKKAKKPLGPEELKARAYKSAVGGSITGTYGGGPTSDEIIGGRRGQVAFRGLKTSKRTQVRGRKHHQTVKPPTPWKTIFVFAIKVCKLKGVVCAAKGGAGSEFDENDILQWMEQFGVAGDEKNIGSLKELKGKLEALLDSDEGLYRHTVSGMLQTYEGSEIASTPMLDALALENRGRRRRKPRRQRKARGSRRNPLDPKDTLRLVDYGVGRGTREERKERAAELERAFEGIEEGAPAGDWDVTGAKVAAFFPRGPGKTTDWGLTKRLSKVGDVNLIARLGDPSLTPEEKNEILSELRDSDMPFMQQASGRSLRQGAELSLRQAIGINRKQDLKRKNQLTMQASSGLCMNSRTRKLSHYTLPGLDDPEQQAGLWRNKDNGLNPNRDVILWVSPKGSAPRVMTFRRGSHIDCDFTSDDPAELPELLGEAIQSSMYWLKERPDRHRGRNASFWVGRAGEEDLYLAWNDVKDTGKAFSVNSILGNLQDGSRKANVLTAREARDDQEYYRKSVSRLFGGSVPGSFKAPPKTRKATPKIDVVLGEGDSFFAAVADEPVLPDLPRVVSRRKRKKTAPPEKPDDLEEEM